MLDDRPDRRRVRHDGALGLLRFRFWLRFPKRGGELFAFDENRGDVVFPDLDGSGDEGFDGRGTVACILFDDR